MQSTKNKISINECCYRAKTMNLLVIGALLLTLTACGSNTNPDEATAKEIAIEKIADYAQDRSVTPTLQDYIDAGVTGVDASNLAEINTAVELLTHDDVDTEAEIQAVADSLGVSLLDSPSLVNASAHVYNENEAITKLSFSNSGGGTLTSCTADTMPAGLVIAISLDLSTCEITGTPTAKQAATIHTITATNITGSDTATVSMEVKSSGTNDVTAPLINIKTPDSDAVEVELDSTVSVTFNEDMFAQTITENSFLLKDVVGDTLPSTVNFDALTNQAVLTPNENLSLLTTYSPNLKPAITDLVGNALADTSWQFITRDGEWQDPAVRISNGAARTPSLAKGDESKAVVVWPQQTGNIDEIWAAQHSKESGWAEPERIQTTIDVDAIRTKVAMNKKGDAIAIWTQGGAVWARHLSDQVWGLSQIISNINANSIPNINIAINEVGDAVVVWKQAVPLVNGTHMWGVNYSFENGWGTAQEVGDDTLTGDVFNPEVAISSQGNAIVAWSYTINTPNFKTTTWTNRFTKGSGWGNEEIIIEVGSATPTPLRFNAFTPKIFIDRFDKVWMAWTEQRTDTVANTTYRVLVGIYQSNGVLAANVIPGVLAGVGASPEIVVDHQGKAITVWIEQDGQNRIVKSSEYVDSAWSTSESIQTDNTRYSNDVKLGVDKTGNAMAVWTEGASSSASPDIWANRYTLNGGWGIAEIIENEDGRALSPQLVVDSQGRAIAVWKQNGRFGGAYILKSNSFK